MAPNRLTHLLAAALAVGTFVLAGCVLAEFRLKASPIPPWIDLKATGYEDVPRTIITATTQTEPTTQMSTDPPATDHFTQTLPASGPSGDGNR